MCDSLQLHGLQHARLLCPPISSWVCSNSCPLSWWCYLTISSSATPFSFCLQMQKHLCLDFPGGSDGKESTCNAGDLGLISGSGRSPGEGNGYPLHYSCLENPMDRGAWRATVHCVLKSRTWLGLSCGTWDLVPIGSEESKPLESPVT